MFMVSVASFKSLWIEHDANFSNDFTSYLLLVFRVGLPRDLKVSKSLFVTIHHWIFLSDSKQLPSIHLGLFRVSLGPCWPHILCVPPVEGCGIDCCLSLKTFTPSCPIFSLSKQYTHIDSWLFFPPAEKTPSRPNSGFPIMAVLTAAFVQRSFSLLSCC